MSVIVNNKNTEITAEIIFLFMQDASSKSDSIAATELRIYSLTAQKDKLLDDLKAKKAQVFVNVSQELGENSVKAKFTNDTQRQAETDRILSEDPLYQDLKSNADGMDDKIIEQKIQLGNLTRQYAIAKTMLDYVALGRRS